MDEFDGAERILGEFGLTSDGAEETKASRDLSIYSNFRHRDPGESSDEEDQILTTTNRESVDEEKCDRDSNTNIDSDEGEVNEYVPLINNGDEEFGEFERYTDHFANETVEESGSSTFMQCTTNIAETSSIEPPIPPQLDDLKTIPSIPPLSEEKIAIIKLTMSKIQLKPPGIGTEALLNNLDAAKIRVGDEF